MATLTTFARNFARNSQFAVKCHHQSFRHFHVFIVYIIIYHHNSQTQQSAITQSLQFNLKLSLSRDFALIIDKKNL